MTTMPEPNVPLPPDNALLLELGAWPPDDHGRCSFALYWRAYRVDLEMQPGLRVHHFHGNLRAHIQDALR
jgi:hypothetical protein